jgi:microsomal dipeptidase-like Zn-dependent dipeptidase
LVEILLKRGYSDSDLEAIFIGNWLRRLESALPARIGQ